MGGAIDNMATPLKPWERSGNGYRPPGQVGAATNGGGDELKKRTDGGHSPQRPSVPPRPTTAGEGTDSVARFLHR